MARNITKHKRFVNDAGITENLQAVKGKKAAPPQLYSAIKSFTWKFKVNLSVKSINPPIIISFNETFCFFDYWVEMILIVNFLAEKFVTFQFRFQEHFKKFNFWVC